MQWNPIIVRESRARWRGMGAFLLLFGYATVLAGALFWRYADASSSIGQSNNPLERIEALGNELFLTLIWMQSLAWALIGPAITATSIAGERESGMLEAMQLSPLSPRQIIAGKLASALSFIALLLLVSVPITATCFLMGGVSPADFFVALALHATTALTGAVLGLACSAWSRKGNIAMRSAYILAIGWLIGSLAAFAGVSITSGMGKPMHWLAQLGWTIFGWSNPIVATAGIVADEALLKSSASAFSGMGVFETSPWLISILFQLLLCGVLLIAATRALRRPFAEQYWMSAKTILPVRVAAGSTPNAAASVSGKRPTREWWLIPVVSHLSFANPVLQREARSKFRMRQPPILVLLFEALLALFVSYFYLRTLWGALFIPDERAVIWWILSFVGLTVVALTSAVSGANAFTREREINTWESLRLSLVSPREIVTAKLGAIVIGFLVFTLPFWPLLLPCIRHLRTSNSNNGVGLVQAVLCLGIILSTGVCYALWGMFWSWRCRKTTAATGWTLSSLFFLLVFFSMFLGSAVNSSSEVVWSFHPFVALGLITSGDNLGIGAATVVLLTVVSGVLWLRISAEVESE